MTTGSLAGSPWRFRKNYEPIRPPRNQDVGPPSPCRLPLRPTVGRRPGLNLHEESRGRGGSRKPATRRPAPTTWSRSCPRGPQPHNGDGTGRGYSKACHPRNPEHAWHSVPYGVALTCPARQCCHDDYGAIHGGLSAQPTGGGPPLDKETPEGGQAS